MIVHHHSRGLGITHHPGRLPVLDQTAAHAEDKGRLHRSRGPFPALIPQKRTCGARNG